MQVVIRYGSENFTRNYAEGTTIGQVLADHELKLVAGWGDNVRASVAGVEQPTTALIPDGATISVETRANSKAE